MQVGDIRLDTDEGISFGGLPGGNADGSEETHTSLLDGIARAPSWALFGGGVGGAFFGATLGAATVYTGFWFLLIPTFLFLRFAVYAFTLAVANERKAAAPNPGDRPGAVDRRKVAEILERAGDLRVEQLAKRLGWSEHRTVHALVAAVDEDEIEEDLDIETGEWVYRVRRVLGGLEQRKTLSATDRLHAIESTQPQGVTVED